MGQCGHCFVSYHIFLKGVVNIYYKVPVIAYNGQFITISFIPLRNSYLNYNSEGQRKGIRSEKGLPGNGHSKNKCNEGS